MKLSANQNNYDQSKTTDYELYNKYFKLFATLLAIFFAGVTQAQINGFSVTCPGGTQTTGNSFPVNLSSSIGRILQQATVTLNYNTALISYDPSCQSVLPSCMTITNNPGTGVLTVSYDQFILLYKYRGYKF